MNEPEKRKASIVTQLDALLQAVGLGVYLEQLHKEFNEEHLTSGHKPLASDQSPRAVLVQATVSVLRQSTEDNKDHLVSHSVQRQLYYAGGPVPAMDAIPTSNEERIELCKTFVSALFSQVSQRGTEPMFDHIQLELAHIDPVRSKKLEFDKVDKFVAKRGDAQPGKDPAVVVEHTDYKKSDEERKNSESQY